MSDQQDRAATSLAVNGYAEPALKTSTRDVQRSPASSEAAEVNSWNKPENANPILKFPGTNIGHHKLDRLEKIIGRLRQDLSKFVRSDSVRPNPIGFHVVPRPGLNISALKIALVKAGDRLEKLLLEENSNDQVAIGVKAMAVNLQTEVDSFRVELFRQLRSDELSAGESVLALRMMMQLRQSAGACLHDLAQFRAALAEAKQ